MNDNPKAALDALANPAPLTLGKMAMLCRMDSPVLGGEIVHVTKTLAALYVYEHDTKDVAAMTDTQIESAAVVEYDRLTTDGYRVHVARMLDAVAAFYEMMPRPSPDAKKNSATDGSPNSPNGSAGPTAGGSTT